MMKIDLHVHSKHSFDCESNVKEIIDYAINSGLSAIAICDHDSMSAYGIAEKYSDKITIIPAMEITTRGGTHIIGLFLQDEIVSRDIFEVIDEIHEQGGLAAIPHPFRAGSGLMFNRDRQNMFSGEEMNRIISNVDLIEAFNYRSTPEEIVKTEQFLSFHPDKPCIAGSDAHFADEVGRACVILDEVKSRALNDIKKALVKSARTIRYEAYSETDGWQTRKLVIRHKKKSLIYRTRQMIPRFIRNPFRILSRRSEKPPDIVAKTIERAEK